MPAIEYEKTEEKEISIASILALGFTKIKAVLIALLIGFVLIGGLKGIKVVKSSNSVDVIADQKKVDDYEFKHNLLKTTFTALNNQYEYLSAEYAASPVMALKAENTVKAVITMAVDSENTANQYVNYFNSINLSDNLRKLSALTVTATKNIEQDIDTATASRSFNNANTTLSSSRTATITSQEYSFDKNFKNCFLKLTVYGASEKNVVSDADYLYSLIQNGKEVVTAISGKHNLMLIDRYTESGSDIAEMQYANSVKLQNIADELLTLKQTLDELEKKEPKPETEVSTEKPALSTVIKTFAKWAVIGAVLGAFLMCLYLLISFISSAPVYSSFEFADSTKLSYLGGLFTKRSWNNRTADKLLNERVFESEQAAAAFITENVKSRIPSGKKVLVASSYYNSDESKKEEIAFVLDALKAAGCEVEFTGDALTSAGFVAKLGTADSVIIFEKRWCSRWQNIDYELETISRFEKDIAGFILA